MIFVFRLLSGLPLLWLHRLGALAGWLSWLFSPTYRRHMRENMILALGEEIERRRPGWIAVAALCDAHIAAHPGVIEALAEKWGADS